MFFRQYGINGLEEVVLFPSLQHDGGPLLAGDGAKLAAGIFRRDGLLQIAFDGQVKPFLRALLNLEAHARREAGFSEMAMALREKSRRRRSSMMVDQRISGRVPGRT